MTLPASDRSLLVWFGDEISLEAHRQVARLTHRLTSSRWILNLHPAFASLLIDFDPRACNHAEIEALVREALASGEAAADAPGRTVEIPVIYGGDFGPDLEDVARHAGLSPEGVVELHASAEYLVYFLGFATCFVYLGGLPARLATPRLDAPRIQVPAGSIGIAGNQTGVYPVASPGGWRLIGRTALPLFDADASPPPLLRMGDRVRFVPVPRETWNETLSARCEAVTGSSPPGIRVVAPGFQTTVQDLGRTGYAQFGVSPSGAADALALRAGNLLVGNAENAAALEMTLVGGAFEFQTDAIAALTGSDFHSGLPLWQPFEVKAGQTLRCGATRSGARGYLCVRGGIGGRRVLGSASAHLLTGVGGRALRRGDVLPLGDAAVRRPRRAPTGWAPCGDPARNGVLRVTPGPQAAWFGDELYAAAYRLSEESNRMGLRLVGPAVPSPPGHMLTEGVPLGAIQVPPGGQPIILFVEHQTTGGYPKPANVISADFGRLGQLRPRDEVRFERVTFEQARDLLREQERWLYALL